MTFNGAALTLDFPGPAINNTGVARVVIEHLTKVFSGPAGKSIRAVNDLSLAVEDRELLVLLGPSGCGKTTTLRLVAGLEEPTAGTIAINGQVVNRVPPKDRDVAMVFQHPALYPHMTVYENLAFGLQLRRYPKAEIQQRVREAAQLLGLTNCLDRRPMALSGGQRQRVALGRALVRRPALFLLDEPLSNLDTPSRARLRPEISRLHARLGSTMIYVTHDQVEAMTLGDRIAVLKDGVVQQLDKPLNLYSYPANLFVAAFIGSPPMNFFHGVLTTQDQVLWFRQTQDGRLGTACSAPSAVGSPAGSSGVPPGDDPGSGGGTPPEPAGQTPALAGCNSDALPTHSGAPAPAGIALRLDDSLAARLNSWSGRQVVLGLRPEHVVPWFASPKALPDQPVEAAVDLIETVGPDTWLHLASAGGCSFVARLSSAENMRAGQKLCFVFQTRHAHFFDPATGHAI